MKGVPYDAKHQHLSLCETNFLSAAATHWPIPLES